MESASPNSISVVRRGGWSREERKAKTDFDIVFPHQALNQKLQQNHAWNIRELNIDLFTHPLTIPLDLH